MFNIYICLNLKFHNKKFDIFKFKYLNFYILLEKNILTEFLFNQIWIYWIFDFVDFLLNQVTF